MTTLAFIRAGASHTLTLDLDPDIERMNTQGDTDHLRNQSGRHSSSNLNAIHQSVAKAISALTFKSCHSSFQLKRATLYPSRYDNYRNSHQSKTKQSHQPNNNLKTLFQT